MTLTIKYDEINEYSVSLENIYDTQGYDIIKVSICDKRGGMWRTDKSLTYPNTKDGMRKAKATYNRYLSKAKKG